MKTLAALTLALLAVSACAPSVGGNSDGDTLNRLGKVDKSNKGLAEKSDTKR